MSRMSALEGRSQAGRTGRARGTQRENAVAGELRAQGWVVGSMRTSAGGGDLIASRLHFKGSVDRSTGQRSPFPEVWLVEVKSTSKPYERFGPADRKAMLEVAEQAGAVAWLAHWPKNGKLTMIRSTSWPT